MGIRHRGNNAGGFGGGPGSGVRLSLDDFRVVPQELLDDIPTSLRVDRSDTASLLDEYLLRLRSCEHGVSYVLAVLVARFVELKGHERLGYANTRDAAREVLGMSPRRFQNVARVGRMVAGHPAIAFALRTGAISFSHAELLARVVTPDNEEHWLSVALTSTVAELTRKVRESCRGSGVPAPDDDVTLDGEPAVRIEGRAPRAVKLLLREVRELVSRQVGRPVSLCEALEAAVAECASGAAAHPEIDEHAVRRLRRRWQGVRLSELEKVERAGSKLAGWSPDWVPEVPAVPDAPQEIDALLGGLSVAGAFEVVERIELLQTVAADVDHQIGRLLWIFETRRLFEWAGFTRLSDYVRERLGMSLSRVRQLIRVERHYWCYERVIDDYRAGAISAVALDIIRPVAEGSRVGPWVDRATRVTMERLKREVEWAQVQLELTGRRPDPPELGAELPKVLEQMSAQELPVDAWEEESFRIVVPESLAHLLGVVLVSVAQPGDPPWKPLERMLRAALKEWKRLPRHRNPIFEDYDYRCAAPGCTERRHLQEHHIHFRSRGGGNERPNRAALCWWHHQKGVHLGLIKLTGQGPSDLHWELGRRPDAPPRARLHGDVYVRGPAATRSRIQSR